MAVRNGMLDLITDLRGMAAVGTADFVAGTTTYYTSQQLQDTLDRHAYHYTRHRLDALPENIGGTTVYYRYALPTPSLEGTASGTAVFRLENSAGSAFAYDAFSIDHNLQIITMDDNQAGSALYLTARGYGLNAAAADIWGRKAAYYADRYDVSTDNHKLSRSQLIANAFAMKKQYAAAALSERVTLVGGTARISRVDTN
jgi:hypothetical protein